MPPSTNPPLRRIAGAILTLALAACASRPEPAQGPRTAPVEPAGPPPTAAYAPPPRAGQRAASIKLDFEPGAERAAIGIETRARLGLNEAALIWPDGREIRAASIEREVSVVPREDRGYGVGVGAEGGSSSHVATGVFIELPVNIFGERRQRSERITLSRARIAIDDEAAYRRQWRDMRVRLKFGFVAGESEVRELPAPRPED